jgi:hypothetical protein
MDLTTPNRAFAYIAEVDDDLTAMLVTDLAQAARAYRRAHNDATSMADYLLTEVFTIAEDEVFYPLNCPSCGGAY